MYGGATAEFFAKIWKKFQKFGPKMRKNPLRIQKIPKISKSGTKKWWRKVISAKNYPIFLMCTSIFLPKCTK
jgi:hypothetical protein